MTCEQEKQFSLEAIECLDWAKSPLIPAVVQDFTSKEVLMLAFMNRQALTLSLQTGQMHYFSRSKNRIWKKGETSGHIQQIKEVFFDCDKDALLFLVRQAGAACHTGNKSCFFEKIDRTLSSTLQTPKHIKSAQEFSQQIVYGIVDTLYHTLLERKSASPDTSYTAALYAKGVNGFGKKIIEEAGEVLLALKDNDKEQIVYECADLLYHILVALAYYNIHPEQAVCELQRRFGLSGLEEKARRKE